MWLVFAYRNLRVVFRMRPYHLGLLIPGVARCVVNPEPKLLAPNLYDNGVAVTPASNWMFYQSQWSKTADTESWIQIDLGQEAPPAEEIILYPLDYPHDFAYQEIVTYGWPARYKIETSNDANFTNATMLVDRTNEDQPDPKNTIITHRLTKVPEKGQQYIRLTATKLGPSNESPNYILGMTKIEIMNNGKDIAVRKNVTVDPVLGYQGRQTIGQSFPATDAPITDTSFITRPRRPMGEGIQINNPDNIINKTDWKPPKRKATTPKTGVGMSAGAFYDAFENNIGYLLNDSMSTVDQLGWDFKNRSGQAVQVPIYPNGYWNGYPGSNAARFLMGASNTLRWTENADLRTRVEALMQIIEDCTGDDHNMMGFSSVDMFEHQNAGYGRSWLTHGLITTGYLGYSQAFDLLRNYYDWFNTYELLDRMNHGSVQGGQGVVANSLVASSPVGVPEDVYTIQQYFQENYWRDGLAQQDPDMLWQYPYDHPHTYLSTSLEPYFDMYLLTGDERYYAMADGFWNLMYNHWINIGGSTSIIEYGDYPPDSQRLSSTGELCGSSFWIRLNQRFHWLHPTKEVYMAQIEQSIYNVIMGNQINDTGLLYHAHLVTYKDYNPVGNMINTCCEGQGTRSLGSIPEFIYSMDPESGDLYVNLFQASHIHWTFKGQEATLNMESKFPYDADVEMTISRLTKTVTGIMYIRIPSWATKNVQIMVNDKHVATGKPGSYEAVSRQWTQNDKISFTLPINYSLIKYDGLDQVTGHTRYGLMYGPVLMAITGPDEAEVVISGSQPEGLFDLLEAVKGMPLHSTIKGMDGYIMKPYWQVGRETFTSVPIIDLA